MQRHSSIHLANVQSVYSGVEGRLWELLMGEQIHIGGLSSSLDLAERAGILAGWQGVDLCCCSGAGMRFLLRFRNVRHMTGVDATPAMLDLAISITPSMPFTGRTHDYTNGWARDCTNARSEGSCSGFTWVARDGLCRPRSASPRPGDAHRRDVGDSLLLGSRRVSSRPG